MYVTQQFQIFDFQWKVHTILDHEFLLPIPDTFTVDTEAYYSRRHKVNDVKVH